MTVHTVCCKISTARLLQRKSEHVVTIRRNIQAKKQYLLPMQSVYLRLITLQTEEHACSLFDSMKHIVCKNDGVPVMQMRAGEGHLTKKILDAGIKNLHVYEKRKIYQSVLKELLSRYGGAGSFHPRTFNDIFFEESDVPLHNSVFLKTTLPFQLNKAWKDSPSMIVLAASLNLKVLLVSWIHLSKNMMHLGMGRPQLILTIPSSALTSVTRKKHYDFHPAGFLFPDFFDFEELGTISPPVPYTAGGRGNSVLREECVIISVAPTKDLEDFASPELLDEYLFFGTQTMNGKAKRSSIVQTVEKFAPGSGRGLVANGMNCFTQFKDLNSKELLQMFRLWRSLPYYDSSVFKFEFNDFITYKKY